MTKNNNKPLVVLAAGGTGGHVYPAEALGRELASRGIRVALITDRRGGTYSGFLGEIDTHRIRAGGLAGKGVGARIASVLELGLGVLQARMILSRLKPDAVVGFGGYASVPTVYSASAKRIATIIHEQNAVLGRANRFLSKRVGRIATSFENAAGMAEVQVQKCVHTGMPTRPVFADVRGAAYPELGADTPLNILVLGGSQGARILSDTIPAAVSLLPDAMRARVHVTQHCRPEDLDRVRAAYAEAKIDAELSDFFNDVPDRLVAAHLLVARAGASTVSEALTVGRPSILIPYPFAIDDHQTANARAVDEAGAGWLMPQDVLTAEGLAERLQALFETPKTLQTAAACALKAGAIDAATRLADLVCGVIGAERKSS